MGMDDSGGAIENGIAALRGAEPRLGSVCFEAHAAAPFAVAQSSEE